MDYTILENIQNTVGQIKVNIKNIADQIMIMNTTITQTQKKVICNGKRCIQKLSNRNIVKQLKKDNKELENKLETSLKQKFEELEGEPKN